MFGEDALVNVSVEKLPDGRLGGYLRIRCGERNGENLLSPDTGCAAAAMATHLHLAAVCLQGVPCSLHDLPVSLTHPPAAHPPPWRRSKTQGIALSLGDKLILKQKGA